MPFTMLLWVLGGLSLVGVPVTAGFVSKWYLIGAALEQGLWPIAVIVLVSSLLALIYVWRVVEVAYFQPPADDAEPLREAPLGMLVPTCVLIGAAIWFGLETSATVDVARQAAKALLGVAR
jgi:multicomponent Na+:H+ antiporter subunit D